MTKIAEQTLLYGKQVQCIDIYRHIKMIFQIYNKYVCGRADDYISLLLTRPFEGMF